MNGKIRKPASHCIYRPELDGFPRIALPVYPRSTGHFIRPEGRRDDYPPGSKQLVQIYWGIDGEGEFELEGRTSILRPGSVFYYLPGEPHRINTRSPLWEYRWITFDGPAARDFMLAYGYPRGTFHAGPCPHQNFIDFENRMLERTPSCWRKMLGDICEIIAAMGGSDEDTSLESRVLRSVINSCKREFRNPEINVNTLADQAGVDRTTLLRLFRKKMRLTPSEYLRQLRLQHALTLLKGNTTPLNEIAAECGFEDTNYFCRFIKQNTNRRPSELR